MVLKPQTTVSGSVLMFYSMVGVMSKADCQSVVKGRKVTLERNVKKDGFQSGLKVKSVCNTCLKVLEWVIMVGMNACVYGYKSIVHICYTYLF